MEGMTPAEAVLLGDRRDEGMFGGSGIWVLFLFFLFFIWGGNGRGTQDGMATRAAVTEGFNFNQLDNGIRSIQNGICDSTYALTNAIKDCCCSTKMAIQDVRYDMSKGFCDVITANNLNTRDLLANQNAGVQKILDYMCANEKQNLRDRIQTLETSGIVQAQTQNLIGQLSPRPIPAYITCSPYATSQPSYGCGYGAGACCGYGYGL